MARTRNRASQVARESKRYRTAVRSFGLRLRALRQGQDLTLEAAAEQMDIDWKHLQKIEAGQLNITLVTLVRIAKGLHVSLDALFEGVS